MGGRLSWVPPLGGQQAVIKSICQQNRCFLLDAARLRSIVAMSMYACTHLRRQRSWRLTANSLASTDGVRTKSAVLMTGIPQTGGLNTLEGCRARKS